MDYPQETTIGKIKKKTFEYRIAKLEDSSLNSKPYVKDWATTTFEHRPNESALFLEQEETTKEDVYS